MPEHPAIAIAKQLLGEASATTVGEYDPRLQTIAARLGVANLQVSAAGVLSVDVAPAFFPVPSYTEAGLPTAGTSGRLAYVTNNIQGLWVDGGTRWYQVGAGDLNVNEFASFAAAITAIGSTTVTLIIPTLQTLTASVAVPATTTLVFTGTGQLSLDGAGVGVTINGPLIAPLRQIFRGTGAIPGNVVFGATTVDVIHPEWWGLTIDGVTNNQNALRSAISTAQNGIAPYKIVLPPGDIAYGTTLILNAGNAQYMHLIGSGGGVYDPGISNPTHGTILRYTGTGVAIQLQSRGVHLKTFHLVGTSSATGGVQLGNGTDIAGLVLEDMTIAGFTGTGAAGLLVETGRTITTSSFFRIALTNNYNGVDLRGTQETTLDFYSVSIQGNSNYGVIQDSGLDVHWYSPIIQSSGADGYRAAIGTGKSIRNLSLHNPYFENNNRTVAGFDLDIRGENGTNLADRINIEMPSFNGAGASQTGQLRIQNTSYLVVKDPWMTGGGGPTSMAVTQAGTNTNYTLFVTATPNVTSVTTPNVYGGTAVGSTLTLSGTSNGSPSGADIFLNSSGQGNIGIGSANADFACTVVRTSAAAGAVSSGVRNLTATGQTRVVLGNDVGSARLTLAYHGSTHATRASQAWLKTEAAEVLIIGTTDVERMRIDTSGQVGIGATPAFTLDVRAAAVSANIQSSTGANAAYLDIQNTGGEILFGRDSSAGGALMAGTTAFASVWRAASTNPIHIGVNNTVALTILNGANVGSGTTNPQSRLHVEGASGWIIADEQDTDPAVANLDANDSVAYYTKNNKLVFAYNNAGTITYLSLPLDGSSTTWTHNTTAP